MRYRSGLVVLVGVVLATALLASPASARPSTGSLSTTIPIPTTTVGDFTFSGALNVTVTQFQVDADGNVDAVVSVTGGSVTVTYGDYTATFVPTAGTRLTLNAQVTADCEGHLAVSYSGLLEV